MRKTTWALACAAALTIAGCGKQHGSLVIVHVTATPQIDSVATLAVKVTADQRDKSFPLSVNGGSIPPEQTFGVELDASVRGTISVDIDAKDNAGGTIVSGSGMAQIVVGGTTDLPVTLGSAVDMGVDATEPADLDEPDLRPVICDPNGVNTPVCVWRWQTPLPVGENLVSVHAFADDDTFAMTTSGAVLHRNGTGWSVLPARPKAAIGNFVSRRMAGARGAFTDLYITGFTHPTTNDVWEVFHSADKGVTWTEEALPATATATVGSTYFGMTVGVGGDVVLAGEWSHILTRAHGTGVWADYQTDAASCPPATGGCATNYDAITSSVLANVATTGTKLSRANVGTNTWTTFATPGGNILNGLCTGPGSGINQRYWGVGPSGVVASSTDSSSWVAQTSGIASALNGCVAITDMIAWAFGASGAIIATTNGGVAGSGTWAGQTSGTSLQLLAGTHSPGTALTIVGETGTILRSTNGGTSYTNERTGPSGSWSAIFGVSPTAVFAVGSGGSIVHTTDGITWQDIGTTGTTANLGAVWASSATDVYAVGASGTLVHSTDGMSFTKYANPGSGGIPAAATLYDVSGLAANNVFVAASTGLYRSTDGGVSFTPVSIPGFTGPAVYSLWAMNGGLWLGGDNGQIYYTTDGTIFASQTLTGIGATLPISRIRGRAPSELYAASSAGAWLAHTTNGGTSWTNGVVMSLGSGAFDLAVTPSGTVYATAYALLVSKDAGVNFVPVTTAPVPTSQIAMYAPSDSEIFATTSGGIVHFGN